MRTSHLVRGYDEYYWLPCPPICTSHGILTLARVNRPHALPSQLVNVADKMASIEVALLKYTMEIGGSEIISIAVFVAHRRSMTGMRNKDSHVT